MTTARFYDPTYHSLNPYSPNMLEWEGILYPTLEHAYHALRYPSKEHRDMILAAKSPKQARDISQTLKQHQDPDWKEKKFDVMKLLMIAKAQQHIEVQNALRLSGNLPILKDIPDDTLWGIGPDGTGENIMGKMWEEIRKDYL